MKYSNFFYVLHVHLSLFFFQAEDGIRDRSPSRGLGDVYKRQVLANEVTSRCPIWFASARGACGKVSKPCDFKISNAIESASLCFWWVVTVIWWQIASGLDQWEFPVAGRTGNSERIWYMDGGQSYFLASLPILPRRYYTRSRPFVRRWTDTVIRVRKKYNCFAVYQLLLITRRYYR